MTIEIISTNTTKVRIKPYRNGFRFEITFANGKKPNHVYNTRAAAKKGLKDLAEALTNYEVYEYLALPVGVDVETFTEPAMIGDVVGLPRSPGWRRERRALAAPEHRRNVTVHDVAPIINQCQRVRPLNSGVVINAHVALNLTETLQYHCLLSSPFRAARPR